MIIILLGITSTSCTINKGVLFFPINEPIGFIENDVLFSIDALQKSRNLRINFQYGNTDGIESYFPVYIQSNKIINNIYIKSININFKELNFSFNKNLMTLIEIRDLEGFGDSGYKYFVGEMIKIFTIDELLKQYNSNISINNFYSKFKKEIEVEYIVTIIYEIDEQNYETKIKWNGKGKRKTEITLDFWEAAMGI